jgi:hypothetical protein
MHIIHWIFDKLLIHQFYELDKQSRDIDISRMYMNVFCISIFNLDAFAVIVLRLYANIFNVSVTGLSIPVAIIVVPAVVVIQGIVLRRNKYVQTLLEQYRAMTPEERKRLSKEGLLYRVIPGLGLMAFYMLILILAWQHVIHI